MFVAKLFKGKVKRLGNPNAKDQLNRPWETGMFKKPTEEKIWLSDTGLVGDEVADKKIMEDPRKLFLLIRKTIILIGTKNWIIRQWKMEEWVRI